MTTKSWLPFHRPTQAPARRDTPRNAFDVMQQEMDRMLSGFLDDTWMTRPGRTNNPWFGDFSASRFSPSVDVTDEKTHLRITAEMPGMDKDDVEIEVHDGALMLKGEKRAEEKSEEHGYYRTERSFGAFQRVIPLPDDVDGTKAEAHFEKGVLTVRMPKVEPRQARKVEIRDA